MPVTLEVTNVERLLVQVLERVVKVGKTSPPHNKKTANLELGHLVSALSKNPKLDGFDSEQGRSLLEGWLRTAVVEMIPLKDSPTGEQIDFLRLLSVASYRSGLPRYRSKHRKIDQLVYRSMVTYWLSNPGASAETLRTAVVEESTLGDGLKFTDVEYPFSEPVYSGPAKIDINALLELHFLEGIPGRDPLMAKEARFDALPLMSAVPAATLPVGKHMVDLMRAYGSWSAAEITTSLSCIVALFMYQLPVRTGMAVRELLSKGDDRELLTDSQNNPMQMYFDFTNNPSGGSSALSKACVARDLRVLNNYFPDMVLLRETEALARTTKSLRDELGAVDGTERLVKIAGLVEDERVEIAAGHRLEQLESDFAEFDDTQNLEIFQALRDSSGTNLDALVKVVIEDRQKDGMASIRKWASSLGGLTKGGSQREHALLSGTMAAPTTWKYSMSEPMLLTLINLCFLDERGEKPKSPSLEMSYLLERLERRFGVLIAKVPEGLDSPEAKQAASENFVAFIVKLKTLGYFRGLSDDFSAQFAERPEAGN
jgi:hypothetical protein